MRTSVALLTVVVALALLVVGLSGVSDADARGLVLPFSSELVLQDTSNE